MKALKRALSVLLAGALLLSCMTAAASTNTSDEARSALADTTEYHAWMRPFSLLEPYHQIKKILSPAQKTVTSNTAYHYERWLSNNLSKTVYTESDWLRELMQALGEERLADEDPTTLIYNAYALRWIPDLTYTNPFYPLSREFAATTLCLALKYKQKQFDCGDKDQLSGNKAHLMTAMFFGYLQPDEHGNANPSGIVNESAREMIFKELKIRQKLAGKRLLSFGDSIMYGEGNFGVGIPKLIGEKYAMKVKDYAVSGAAFGYVQDRSQIPKQIIKAAKSKEVADVILINGGTNDMRRTTLGEMSYDFTLKNILPKSFSGGMEYSFCLLRRYWPDTPALYIRAHNMNHLPDNIEKRYGNQALKICKKWSMPYVDIYSDTGFNCENQTICDRYTMFNELWQKHDSIHPTKDGYYTFYLPSVTKKMLALLRAPKVSASSDVTEASSGELNHSG